MSKYQYTNASNKDLVLVGIGTVPAGGQVESDHPIENAHLELSKQEEADKPVNEESKHGTRNKRQ